MNCKHATVTGKTTKYFKCGITNRPINEIKCSSCPLRLPKENEILERFFRGFKK